MFNDIEMILIAIIGIQNYELCFLQGILNKMYLFC